MRTCSAGDWGMCRAWPLHIMVAMRWQVCHCGAASTRETSWAQLAMVASISGRFTSQPSLLSCCIARTARPQRSTPSPSRTNLAKSSTRGRARASRVEGRGSFGATQARYDGSPWVSPRKQRCSFERAAAESSARVVRPFSFRLTGKSCSHARTVSGLSASHGVAYISSMRRRMMSGPVLSSSSTSWRARPHSDESGRVSQSASWRYERVSLSAAESGVPAGPAGSG